MNEAADQLELELEPLGDENSSDAPAMSMLAADIAAIITLILRISRPLLLLT